MNLEERFKKYEDQFLKFETVQNPMSCKRDVHAFILLTNLLPNDRRIISAAEHDQIWLDVDCEKLAELITDDQIRELVACGVFVDEYDSLSMFA